MVLIRGTSLTGYRELAVSLGQDPAALLHAAGVHPRDAGDHEAFISYRALAEALELLAAKSGRSNVGLRLARLQGIEILGPVGVAARTAPTMAVALDIFSHYLAAYSPAIEVRLVPEERPERTFLEFRVLVPHLPPHPQVVELSVAIALRVFRFLLGADYQPLAVHLPHDRVADAATYRTELGSNVRFAQRRAGLLARSSDLDRPLENDTVAHAAMVRYLDGLMPGDHEGLTGPVRALVRQLLPTGSTTIDLVAAQFQLHPKTLQRRLRQEGLTFAEIVDDVRRETAEHYLRMTALPLGQLTRELGYSEQSALSRACRRWFGRGPREYRRTGVL